MSNYEIMKKQMATEFLKYDQERMAQKFSLIGDAEYLYVTFFSRAYRIRRRDGYVEWSDDGFARTVEANYNEAMTIYDILCSSREDCHLAGEFVNMNRLSSVQGGPTMTGAWYQDVLHSLDGRNAALSRACERLGGVRFGKADVSYQIPMFPFFPLVFQFWNSDEDFPASVQFLLDKNALQYLHYETVWFAVSHLIERLAEEIKAADGTV